MTVKVSYATEPADPYDNMTDAERDVEMQRQLEELREIVRRQDERAKFSEIAGTEDILAKFDEQEHPRDDHGRFAETPGGGDLTDDEREALMSYGTNGYHSINSFLRGGEDRVASDFEQNQGYRPDDLKEIVETAKGRIEAIDSAFSKVSPLAQDVKTFRGLVLPEGLVPTAGASFSDKAYVSTTSNQESADEFSTYYLDESAGGGASNGLPPERIAIAEITIPAGTSVIDMQDVWDSGLAGEESEKLLGRGATFTITDVTTDDLGRYRLKMVAG